MISGNEKKRIEPIIPARATTSLDHLRDQNVGAVSGCQIPIGGDRFMDKVNQVVWGLHNETQRYCNDHGIAQHLGGVLFAIRRGICDHVPEDVVNDDAYMGVECRRRLASSCQIRQHFRIRLA